MTVPSSLSRSHGPLARCAGLAALWLALVLPAAPAAAVTAVNPFGVNVRSSGPTTVFLTFQNLRHTAFKHKDNLFALMADGL